MKTVSAAAAMLPALALVACSSEPAPGPVEQIVVRDPSAPPVQQKAAEPVGTVSDEETLIAAGKSAYAVCSGCHVVDADAASTAGPNLHMVAGRAAGARDDFAYSDALKAANITWSDAELDAYLSDPAGKVPGTTMVAGAVQDADQRAAIIAYLNSLAAS